MFFRGLLRENTQKMGLDEKLIVKIAYCKNYLLLLHYMRLIQF